MTHSGILGIQPTRIEVDPDTRLFPVSWEWKASRTLESFLIEALDEWNLEMAWVFQELESIEVPYQFHGYLNESDFETLWDNTNKYIAILTHPDSEKLVILYLALCVGHLSDSLLVPIHDGDMLDESLILQIVETFAEEMSDTFGSNIKPRGQIHSLTCPSPVSRTSKT